jgi:hypothetical protein
MDKHRQLARLGVGGFGPPKKKVGLGRVGSRKALIMLDLAHRKVTRGTHVNSLDIITVDVPASVEGGTTSPRAGLTGLRRVS